MFRGLLSESRSRIDRLQIAGLCGLMLLGVLFVYSATMVTESAISAPLYKQKWVLQIAWYILGLGAAMVICLVNYQTLARWSMIAYWFGIALLALVLILKEPDLGSALVLVPTGVVMLFVAGTPKKFLLRLFGGIGLLAALFLVDVLLAPPGWWEIKLENYQHQRLQVYFGADFARPNASAA